MIKQITREQSEHYSDLPQRKEYNNNINQVPSKFKEGTFIGNKLLVKMFKFEKHTTSSGGVIDVKLIDRESEGGRPIAPLDTVLHQNRAIIIAVSPDTATHIEEHFPNTKEHIQAGAIVWIDPKTLTMPFIHSPEYPVQDSLDYFLITPGQIQFIEEGKYEINFIPSDEEIFTKIND